jgi:catechol 2,3-dioxygenase-like lactoylglutathione lyase family enzyme
MTPTSATWSVRSVLVSVSDLRRSVAFYQDVVGVREVAREGEVVVLEGDRRAFVVVLHEVGKHATRYGQQALGPRSVGFDVASQAELDAVAQRLEEAQALRSRRRFQDPHEVEVVTGRDPDGLPLVFFSYEVDDPASVRHRHLVALLMYGVDL